MKIMYFFEKENLVCWQEEVPTLPAEIKALYPDVDFTGEIVPEDVEGVLIDEINDECRYCGREMSADECVGYNDVCERCAEIEDV